MFYREPLLRVCCLVVCMLIAACAEMPHRPHVAASVPPECGVSTKGEPGSTTPESGENYVIHYLEFDDQGWPHPGASSTESGTGDSAQMDCAIASLAHEVKNGEVLAIVFVHGWKHSAADDDRDVNRFRYLVEHQASQERGRKIVGFYVAWNGKTVDLPVAANLTFWSRKNAAHHVSLGSVRGLFARIKALRNHYNRPKHPKSKNCGREWRGESQTCQLRTVMIGHSFGAQILYESVAPYVLETLTGARDVPEMKVPVTARQRGIADLILLLNPAFEATKYEPVHRAAMYYRPEWYEPPLLVSLTSSADHATRFAFPIARTINSALQYPATSTLESQSIRQTHGHIDGFLTHRLSKEDLDPSPQGQAYDMSCFGGRSDAVVLRNKFAADSLAGTTSKPGWSRKFCGGLTLDHRADSGLPPRSIVWNVQTDDLIMPGHNAIDTQAVFDFANQLYLDLSTSFRPLNAGPLASKADEDESDD